MFPTRNKVFAFLALAFTAAFAAAPSALGDSVSRATPLKFAGTFFGDNSRIITYNADGTVFLVLADMFTEDVTTPSAGRKTTPQQGVWRKVGANTIQVTTLSFATEQLGHNYNANGFILKTKWLAIFDDPVKGVSPGYTAVNIVAEGFLPGQNPITDSPAFELQLPDGRAERLPAE